MRLLWIGKQPTGGEAGDEVFDRKTIAACRRLGHEVDVLFPTRVGMLRELLNLASGVPHYRARFACSLNRRAVGRQSGYDATICSWEPFDALGSGLQRPAVMILHNVTSSSLPALFPGNIFARLAAKRARAWEGRSYRASNFAALAVLSRRDLTSLENLPGRPKLLLLPPGMPPCFRLSPAAVLLPEIVITGTYDWTPKRRDMLRFAQEYAALPDRIPIRATALPPQASQLLLPQPLPASDENRQALRFGLITDRFQAGHKLKTLAYVACNQIVLSFTDVSHDVAHIPDHQIFIRKLDKASDIASHVKTLAAMPAPELRERFTAFQAACAAHFTWDAIASTLLDAAAASSAYGSGAPLATLPLPPAHNAGRAAGAGSAESLAG